MNDPTMNVTRPACVRYWRRRARAHSHRDWHTAYAGASWTGRAGQHCTSFQGIGTGRYVPVCSCGFRGTAVSSAVSALAAANAHARALGAEPLPPRALS